MKKLIKKYKEILIALIIILIVVLGQVIHMNIGNSDNKQNIEEKDKTESKIEIETFDEEVEISMHDGENFAKIGNKVICADYDKSIYMFDLETRTGKKLCSLEDGINRMYFDGEYVYAMPSYYRGKGIYKIDLLGNVKKIYDGASIQLWITDNSIYFVDQIGYDQINGTPQGNLCIMDKDGNNKKVIIENVKNTFHIVNNYIYYVDQVSRSIYRANIDGNEKTKLADGRCYITNITDKYLTYVDFDDEQTLRIIYLKDNKNNEVGRFGNALKSNYGAYIYTRKILNVFNNVEDENSLYEIDLEREEENRLWKADEIGLDHLDYIYNNYCYFLRGSDYYRVKLSNGKEKENLNFGSGSYFVNGKAYQVRIGENGVSELCVYNLDDLSRIKIEI